MKKIMFLLMSLVVVTGLTACEEAETTEKDVGSVETSGNGNNEEGNEENDGESEETTDYDEVLIDSENAKVTLESITKVEDELFDDEYYSIKLAIENKLDKTITVQTDDVSIDGLMVTDEAFFSEDVAGGKKANGEMQIETFDEELPPLEDELEMLLLVIDEDTFDDLDNEQVNIEIK